MEKEKKEEKSTKKILEELESLFNEGLDRFLKLSDDNVSKNSLWRVIKKAVAYPERENEVMLQKKIEKELFEAVRFLQETKEMISVERIRLHHENLANEIKNNYEKAEEFDEKLKGDKQNV